MVALSRCAAPSSKGGTVSAELLAQKRAALGAPNAKNQQAAGASAPDDGTALDVPASRDGAERKSASEGLSSRADGSAVDAGIPAISPTLAAAVAAKPAHDSPERSGELLGNVSGGIHTADGSSHDRRAATSTLPFQQLCLTFKHGAVRGPVLMRVRHVHGV